MRLRGIALAGVGVLITFLAGLVSLLTYREAASSPGGLYFVLIGPIILGAFMVIRGADPAVRHAARYGGHRQRGGLSCSGRR